jgi:hypothetical protein
MLNLLMQTSRVQETVLHQDTVGSRGAFGLPDWTFLGTMFWGIVYMGVLISNPGPDAVSPWAVWVYSVCAMVIVGCSFAYIRRFYCRRNAQELFRSIIFYQIIVAVSINSILTMVW